MEEYNKEFLTKLFQQVIPEMIPHLDEELIEDINAGISGVGHTELAFAIVEALDEHELLEVVGEEEDKLVEKLMDVLTELESDYG